jgi:hypothetical protein
MIKGEARCHENCRVRATDIMAAVNRVSKTWGTDMMQQSAEWRVEGVESSWIGSCVRTRPLLLITLWNEIVFKTPMVVLLVKSNRKAQGSPCSHELTAAS